MLLAPLGVPREVAVAVSLLLFGTCWWQPVSASWFWMRAPARAGASRQPRNTGHMSTVVVLQPGYLPWLGFFDQLRRADVFVYYDDVQYDKHGWRNRNRIKTQAGRCG